MLYQNTNFHCFIFSGINEIKLLGAPKLPEDSEMRFGSKVAQLSYDLLVQWDCVKNVKTMVFDTTSANTRHISAACIAIQEKLGRQLLWCPCCHHIGEIVIS